MERLAICSYLKNLAVRNYTESVAAWQSLSTWKVLAVCFYMDNIATCSYLETLAV